MLSHLDSQRKPGAIDAGMTSWMSDVTGLTTQGLSPGALHEGESAPVAGRAAQQVRLLAHPPARRSSPSVFLFVVR